VQTDCSGVRLGVSANLYKACCRKAAVETFEFECELPVWNPSWNPLAKVKRFTNVG
jgi:hypothetical protein